MTRPLRLVYAAGPGDVIGTYRHWLTKVEDPTEIVPTYSGQFFNVCQAFGHAAYVIASHPRRDRLADGAIAIEHRVIPFASGPGPLYHLGQVWSALRLTITCLWFRADAVIVLGGTCHWFALWPLTLMGVKLIPTLHNLLWRKYIPPTRLQRLIGWLDSALFRRRVRAALSASTDITRQVRAMTGGRCPPIFEFLPTYRAEVFSAIGPPPAVRRPFRVFFAGRIEADKGVFDLLAIAQQLFAAGRTDIEFDLCGSGSRLEELRAQAAADPLTARGFRLHGHSGRAKMQEMYANAHIVIVPTTSAFNEGFNQVVSEGILSGRPVITSDVCPALDYVREGVVEVKTDDRQAYFDAILRLCDDPDFYESKRQGCLSRQAQFYDTGNGWGAALKQALALVGPLSKD